MDAGLARAGFRHVFFCESDEWRRGILAQRFPGIPIFNDVRKVAKGSRPGGLRAVGAERDESHAGRGRAGGENGDVGSPVDLLCGGFPCQDLSVAGKRAGFKGERSSLFFEFARIAGEFVRPGGYLLIENVPGLFSSHGGRDFAAVLGTLADLGFCDLAWRVLDSRFFGVAQRRRRVFILARRARGQRSAEVLLESESVRRDSPARTETREEVAGTLGAELARNRGLGNANEDGMIVAGTLGSHSATGGPRTTDLDGHGALIPELARSLNSQRDGYNDGSDQTYVPALTRKMAKGTGGPSGDECQNLLAVPISQDALRGEGVAKTPSPDAEWRVRLRDPGFSVGNSGDPAFTLAAAGPGAVGIELADPISANEGRTYTHEGTGNFRLHNVVVGIRRLTPTECERLQGLPDGWTLPGSDSRRYAAIGDAVTANVSEWIGRRLLAAEKGFA